MMQGLKREIPEDPFMNEPMTATDRYVVQAAHRNARGEWYGSTAPDPDDLWFFIRDTAVDAPDWTDDEIAPGPYFEEARATCELLNRLTRAARPSLHLVPSSTSDLPDDDCEMCGVATCPRCEMWMCPACSSSPREGCELD